MAQDKKVNKSNLKKVSSVKKLENVAFRLIWQTIETYTGVGIVFFFFLINFDHCKKRLLHRKRRQLIRRLPPSFPPCKSHMPRKRLTNCTKEMGGSPPALSLKRVALTNCIGEKQVAHCLRCP